MADHTPDPNTPTLENPRVVPDSQSRFEIHVDDSGEAAGATYFVDREAADGTRERIFPHTEVKDEFEGKGIASTLVRQALDQSIEDGFRIVPICPYVKSWIERHSEYQEHVTKPRPEHFAAVQEN